jgi:hypothetical protein
LSEQKESADGRPRANIPAGNYRKSAVNIMAVEAAGEFDRRLCADLSSRPRSTPRCPATWRARPRE